MQWVILHKNIPAMLAAFTSKNKVETNSQIPFILKLPEAVLACLHFQTKLPAKQAGRANSLLMYIVSSLKLMPFLFSLPMF